jgi:Protein of unknown function (DUF3105)
MSARFRRDARCGPGRSIPELGSARPLARYTLLWSAAAAVVVLLVLGGLQALDRRDGPRAMPPPPAGVSAAARAAGCSFARIEGPMARAPDRPPVVGAARARPALDGAYAQAPPVGSLVAALARGRVVVQYRDPLGARERALLDDFYHRDPRELILTPDQTRMDGAVAVTAWRRVLACPRIDSGVVDALAAFRDRFRGARRP